MDFAASVRNVSKFSGVATRILRLTQILLPLGAGVWVVGCGDRSTSFSETSQIIGTNNLEVIEKARGTVFYEYARAVASATFGDHACTAFRVAADLFVTNNHCWENSQCSSSDFTLGYEQDLVVGERRAFRCQRLVSRSESLDYALYQVRPLFKEEDGDTYPIAKLSKTPAVKGQMLFVAGFPFGFEFKRMDRSDDCKVLRPASSTSSALGHTCDTDSGSSGSSVFDRETGAVVGLHWGFGAADANSATSMPLILSDIESRAPTEYARLTIVQ